MSFHHYELGVQVAPDDLYRMMPTCGVGSETCVVMTNTCTIAPKPKPPKPPNPKPPKPRGVFRGGSSETELNPELLRLREQLRQALQPA